MYMYVRLYRNYFMMTLHTTKYLKRGQQKKPCKTQTKKEIVSKAVKEEKRGGGS